MFRLIINPESFGQSVENLFYLSFLIRDGKAALEFDEKTAEPVVCEHIWLRVWADDWIYDIVLSEAPTVTDYSEGLKKRQMVMELDMETWQVR